MMLVLIHKILFCLIAHLPNTVLLAGTYGTILSLSEERQKAEGWSLDKNTFLCLHLISKNIIDVRYVMILWLSLQIHS